MPQFGNFILSIPVYIVALMIIVFVHEMGHYLVGRWTGIRAEVFSIGMGKRLWSRVDRHGTRWQIAAVPLGGYVKFVGDANAASAGMVDLADLPVEQRRQSMLLAPLWARFLTVLAGPVFNFIFAAIVFTILVLVQGVEREPLTVGELSNPALKGLQVGDEIVSIAGIVVPSEDGDWSKFADSLPKDKPEVIYEVRRGGELISVLATHPYPAVAGPFQAFSQAEKAGVMEGDWVIALDGQPVPTFDSMLKIMDSATGAPVEVTVRRAGVAEDLKIIVTPKRQDVLKRDGSFETRWILGIGGSLSFKTQKVTPPLFTALKSGVTGVWVVMRTTVVGVYHMVRGDLSSCGVSGPFTIATVAADAAKAGFVDFVGLVALLSAAIGFMNLFPIPVLDGGHIVFQAYEAVFRRKPHERVLGALTVVGLTVVLALMMLGLFNDFRVLVANTC